MSYAKEKGKMLENHVADLIISKGLDSRAKRDGASGAGNREKGDVSTSMMILNQNAGIECKNHNTLHIPEWWKQAQKLESLGREPMLVYKLKGTGFENTLCTMYLDTVLELIKASQDPKNAPRRDGTIQSDNSSDREISYAINAVKVAISKLDKLLN